MLDVDADQARGLSGTSVERCWGGIVKRTLSTLLVSFLTLAGCGGGDSPDAESGDTASLGDAASDAADVDGDAAYAEAADSGDEGSAPPTDASPDSNNAGDAAPDGSPDAAVDGPTSDVAIDAPVEVGVDAGGCTVLSPGVFAINSYSAAGVFAALSPDQGGSDPDDLSIEFYETGAYRQRPGVYDLGQGDDADYATCDHCVLVLQDVVSGAGTKLFFAVSGTIVVSSVTSPPSGEVAGSLQNVRLVEATIDPNTYHSAPVAGGECRFIASAAWNTATKPCQPFASSTGCTANEECYILADSYDAAHGKCLPVGTNAADAPCSDVSAVATTDCVAGYVCIGSAPACREQCDFFGASKCSGTGELCDAPNEACLPAAADPAVVGGTCGANSPAGTRCGASSSRYEGACVGPAGTCAKWCRMSQPDGGLGDGGVASSDCSGGKKCVDVFGYGGLGVCE